MGIDIKNNVPLSPLTTLGLGGHARFFTEVGTIEELREALEYSRRHSLSYFLLGGGSNTIFLDQGFNGLVIRMGLRGVAGLSASAVGVGSACSVQAAAGEPWDEFVAACVAAGLGGIECLSGIPGQVGATPIQNVGAYGQEVSSTIERVDGLDRNGSTVSLSADECGFGYRRSRFKEGDALIITGVRFLLRSAEISDPAYPELRTVLDGERRTFLQRTGCSPDAREDLALLRDAVLKIRRGKSMVVDLTDPDTKSVGSFFMNPVLGPEQYREFLARVRSSGDAPAVPVYPSGESTKVSAAWLVEHAGFSRGYTENGAGISKAHSLALVNRGGRTEDLLALAKKIQQAVLERFGIPLSREPVLVPFE